MSRHFQWNPGISVLCLVATATALPCHRPEDNFLSIFAQTTLLFSFGACTLVKILSADSITDEQLTAVVGFHSAQGPFFVLCFCSLAFMFVLLVMFVLPLYPYTTPTPTPTPTLNPNPNPNQANPNPDPYGPDPDH